MQSRLSVLLLRAAPGVLAMLAGADRAMGVSPFPAALELSTLDGTNGLTLNGVDVNDVAGWMVSGIGDVNGDGIDDVIVGGPRADPLNRFDAGESYVVFGRDTSVVGPFAPSIDLDTLDGSNGFMLNGRQATDLSGWSAAGVGDVNGDGVDDFAIGARYADPGARANAGECYVVFGRNAAVEGPFAAVMELSSLDGASGFTIRGNMVGSRCGWAVSTAGDFNGDSVDDLVVSADRAEPGQQIKSGQCYVIFGRRVSLTGPFAAAIEVAALSGGDGFAINGADPNDYAGISVSGGGDFNGDGLSDIVIGAHRADPFGVSAAGEAYVVFGRSYSLRQLSPSVLELADIDGNNGFVLNGIDMDDRTGISVASIGDLNGDGVDDLAIGAYRGDPGGFLSAGETYVVFGRNAAVQGSFGAALNLASLDGATGFVLNGIDSGDNSGVTVAAAGDVNADGIADLLVGAQAADPNGRSAAGECYVVFGRDTEAVGLFPASFALSSLDGTTGFTINGIDTGDFVGHSISSAGDFNGDGIDDIILGAPYADPNARVSSGESYIVFGRAPIVCAGDVNGDGPTDAADFVILAGNFGFAVPTNTGGDLNGDGLVNAADFVILAGDFGCQP